GAGWASPTSTAAAAAAAARVVPTAAGATLEAAVRPPRPVKRAIAVLAVILLAGLAAGLWYYHKETEPNRVVRGSTTIEFVTTQAPEREPKRPKRVVRQAPWITYGYDDQRTHAPTDFYLRPPFRRLWTLRTGYYIEFPPAVAYGRVFVAQLK